MLLSQTTVGTDSHGQPAHLYPGSVLLLLPPAELNSGSLVLTLPAAALVDTQTGD